MMIAAGLVLTAALLAWLMTPLAKRYSEWRGLIDEPGPRRSHDRAIARGGGIAPAWAIILAAAFAIPLLGQSRDWGFIAGALLLLVVGWADDHHPLAVRWRLAAQILAAGIAVFLLGLLSVVEFRLGGVSVEIHFSWLWTPLAVLAMVWLVNLFNFMDGADGLATSQTLISATLFAIGFLSAGETANALIAAIVAAAALGFLCWNWPPAAIFLGDSGSLVFGWCMAWLAFAGAGSGAISPVLAAIATAPFVIDATATLASRVRRGEQWYTPHRDHAYQRLLRSGWRHGQLLVAWTALNLLMVVPAFAIALLWPEGEALVAVVLGVLLVSIWKLVINNHNTPSPNR